MNETTQLVERATVEITPGLIQNGSTPDNYSESGSRLVERVADGGVTPALIQNGSTPESYTEKSA